MGDHEIINAPNIDALFFIYSFVCNAPVIWIDCESLHFLFDVIFSRTTVQLLGSHMELH